MKNNLFVVLPVALFLDLLIPFLLAPSYKGYHHFTQVMSVLGNEKAPLHVVYNIWLIVLGILLIINNFAIYRMVAKYTTILAILLFVAVFLYAVGGCILSGAFSVGETKSLMTFSEKVHGYGSVIGFMALAFAPLWLCLYGFKAEKTAFGVFALICFILAMITFALFIMADKPNYQNTVIAYEGLWQRLPLLFMYLPVAGIYMVK